MKVIGRSVVLGLVALAALAVLSRCNTQPKDLSTEALGAARAKLGCAAKPQGAAVHACRILVEFDKAEAITTWPKQGKSTRWLGRLVAGATSSAALLRLVGTPSKRADLEFAQRDFRVEAATLERLFSAAATGKAPTFDNQGAAAKAELTRYWAKRLTFDDHQNGQSLLATNGRSTASASCKKPSKQAPCRLLRRSGKRILVVAPAVAGAPVVVAELWPTR